MDLAERHTQLAELNAALRDARSGQGSVVLVTGEAGAGKTALVRRFVAEAGVESRVLWGLCDELATPRPLGPFLDMAIQVGAGTPSAPAGDRGALVDELLREMSRSPRVTVAVVEDAHWADDATTDAIRFIGRRIRQMPALLVVTFRGNEVPPDHPLRRAIGATPPDDIRRIVLPLLSVDGVAKLAGRRDVDELYELTGGNPFFVTEVLASPNMTVPDTVQDAVMARVGRLTLDGATTVQTAAVMPDGAEVSVLKACGVATGVDDAVRRGVLELRGETARFTHELTRQAVEMNLTATERVEINKRVLTVLADAGADPARLTHHAVEAEDASAVARHAPEAAERARELDSHREAAAHLRRALEHPGEHSDRERALLWFALARECSVTGRHQECEDALEHAIELFEAVGDEEHVGVCLSLLSSAHWFNGHGKEAHEALDRATTILERHPPGSALAWAYAQRARLAMVDWRGPDAVMWGDRAIALARTVGDPAAQAHALNTAGMARWMIDPADTGMALESLRFALDHGLMIQAGRVYANIVSGYMTWLDYDTARRYIDEGLAFCADHDALAAHTWLLGQQARWYLERGHWARAEEVAEQVLETSDTHTMTAVHTLGLLYVRRGSEAADQMLAEAARLAEQVGDAQTVVPITMARLEHAWLAGRHHEVTTLADQLAGLVDSAGGPHLRTSMIWLWLHRAGVLDRIPNGLFEPIAAHIRGDWRRAAAGWADVGLPYAQADALADADEPAPLLKAVGILDRLGATPRAAMVRAKLAKLGVAAVPRGPHRSTRTNPAGLTRRQVEVLRLLADGLTYQQIADKLYLSIKTVDHHVAAVRTKLDAGTRDDAVAAAHDLGILRGSDG